jgi:predicted homoserine dehydrogenase-like protein
VTRDELTKVFCLRSQGGILEREGVVDYAIGDVHPGVFVIVTTDNPTIRAGLVQRDMGPGPNYLLFRPYHLCSIEVPLTVARAVFYGESSGSPLPAASSECVAIAKRDLAKGETLDGIGEYCYRGSIVLTEAARAAGALPLGLAKGCMTRREIPAGTVIGAAMVEPAPESLLQKLRESAS